MKRKKFLKNICGYGFCSCMGLSLISSQNLFAQDGGFSQSKDSEWKRNFIQKRFNWLLLILEKDLDKEQYTKIIHQLGIKCAQSVEYIANENKGNPEGYFKKINSMWGEVFDYDKEKQIVRINTNLKECPCSNVNMGITPKSYCNCSLGWQKYMFEIVFGKPVEVKHIETILRGGRTCKFEIKIL